MRPVSHRALRKFVDTEGWTPKGTARGKGKVGDHERYTLALATGEVLYTRISHGAGEISDPKLVAQIFREQLRVSEAESWACVDNGVLPTRPRPEPQPGRGEELDGVVVRNLIRRAGLTAEEVGTLSKDEAVARWQEWLSRGSSGS